jgi:hypothetical protein
MTAKARARTDFSVSIVFYAYAAVVANDTFQNFHFECSFPCFTICLNKLVFSLFSPCTTCITIRSSVEAPELSLSSESVVGVEGKGVATIFSPEDDTRKGTRNTFSIGEGGVVGGVVIVLSEFRVIFMPVL